MADRISDGKQMVAQMAPRLVPGVYAFRTLSAGEDVARIARTARALFHEDEGISVIEEVDKAGKGTMAQITLDVLSALDGVGLTAAVSTTLADKGIPCNMVAGHHHDHVFVPSHQAGAALTALTALSADGSGGRP
jgi:hypothetical protein